MVGVVLSGSLDGGSAGLLAVHTRGGVTRGAGPEDAVSPGMPRSAIAAAQHEARRAEAEAPDG